MAEVSLSNTEFKALSSETRTQALKHLKERNHTLSELAKKLGMSAPTVKEHLDILANAGLVQLNDEGRKWKYYALTRKGKGVVGDEDSASKTTFLLILGASGLALVGTLLLLAGSLNLGAGEPLSVADAGTEAPLMAAAIQESAAMKTVAPPMVAAPSAAPAPALAETDKDPYIYLAIALGLSAFIGFQAGRLRREPI